MKCRSCLSGDIIELISLGDQYLSDFRADEKKPPKYPLDLVICNNCKLVQLKETTPSQYLYTDNYGYESGINGLIKADLKDVVYSALAELEYEPTEITALDIGCNDGTLLSNYSDVVYKIGFDPVPKFREKALSHANAVVNDFFNAERYKKEFSKPNIITSISMFYDLDDPNQFVLDIEEILADNGIWVCQQNYLGTMISNTAYCNICLPPEDLIVTKEGLRPIEEVNLGDYVMTHKGRFRAVNKVFKNQFEGDLISLKAYGFGHKLRVTPEHPVMVKRNNEWKFIPAKDVIRGDIVGRPVRTEVEPITQIATPGRPPTTIRKRKSTSQVLPINEDLMRVCGWYLAEGCVNHKNNSVTFYFGHSDYELELAKRCSESLKNLGFKANIYPGNSTRVISYGEISRFLGLHFGEGANNKKIPHWIYGLPAHQQRPLLESYACEGDGYSYRNNKYWRASSVSRQLAFDISQLSNCLGLKASISQHIPKRKKNPFDGRKINSLPLWDILIHLNPQRKQKVWFEDGYQCGRVYKTTTESYSGFVYNIEVDEDNTYVSPAMTVHNCHEHIEYYSLYSFERLLEKFDLEVFKVSQNTINGGSFRTFICHRGMYAIDPSVQAMRDAENNQGLNKLDVYQEFATEIGVQSRALTRLIKKLHKEGKTIYVYGASTRGNTLLQTSKLNAKLLQFAVERNQFKWGKKISSIQVPIISEEEFRLHNPDFILILPWFLADEMLPREEEFMKQGGSVILPLPKVELVDYEKYIKMFKGARIN